MSAEGRKNEHVKGKGHLPDSVQKTHVIPSAPNDELGFISFAGALRRSGLSVSFTGNNRYNMSRIYQRPREVPSKQL